MNFKTTKQNFNTRLGQGVAVLGFTVASMASQAAIDTAGITSAVADAATAVGVIGAAIVLVRVGVKVFKWIAAAL